MVNINIKTYHLRTGVIQMTDNWLKRAADLEEKLEKAEYKGFLNAYKHCKKLCNQVSFTAYDGRRTIRVADIEHILDGLIEYYTKEIERGNK